MKTAMKRILGLVLCFVLLVSMIPATQAFAELASGTCGANAKWSLSDDGTLTISGSGAMNNYGNDRPWSAHNYEIKKLVVKSGITSIGDYAFASCANLTSATLADTVTSIGKGAFTSTGLTSITIPSKVTSIGVSAFEYCTKLTSVTLPAKLTAVQNRSFFWCTALKSVNIPVGVTSIGVSAFEACKAMTSVTIPAGVTAINANAFKDCASLSALSVPAGVSSIGDSAFEGCAKLATLSLPNGLTTLGTAAFKNCSALTAINLPVGLTSISEEAFMGCSAAASLSIPAGVTTIGNNAFQGCSALTAAAIPAGVTSIGDNAFQGCSALATLTLPAGLKIIGEYAFANCAALKAASIPTSVTTIGNYAFFRTGLTSVSIPASVTSLGANPFSGCGALTEIKAATDSKNFASVNGVLFNKDKTKLLAYPCGKTASSYTVPSGVKTIGEHSFEYNTNLKSVTVPSGVSTIGQSAFNACTALESVTIPGSVTSIGQCAFCDCSALKSVTIPSGVTQIADYCFYNCTALESVNLPGSVTTIGDYAFRNCTALNALTLPENLERIGVTALAYCTSLETLTLPASLKNIGMYAFSGDTKLSTVLFQGSAPSIGDVAFSKVTATVRYPDDGSWTDENRLNYGGTLTWQSYAQATILTQPASVTAVAGKTASFSVTAYGQNLQYQWQVKTPGSSNWVNVTNAYCSGMKTAKLTVPATMARNGNLYRCVVSNSGGTATSNAAKLTVVKIDKPVITKQPQSVAASAGTKAYFTVVATGENLSYQWQTKMKSDGDWINVNNPYIEGAKTAKLIVPSTKGRNGYEYRCVVTNPGGSVTSAAVKLTVADIVKPTLTKQPGDVTAVAGTNVKFSVEATGENLSYQWQTKMSSDGNWVNVTNAACSGMKTATLTVPATAARNGYQYRCIVSNEGGSVISTAATLKVTNEAKPALTKQPANANVAAGTSVKFTVEASGFNLKYQWEVKMSSTGDWVKVTNTACSGMKTATLTVPATLARNGYQYRCVVTNDGGSVTSNAAKLTVGAKPAITKQPTNVTTAAGTKAVFTVEATGATGYQWQVKDSGGNWINVNNPYIEGAKTNKLTVPATAARNGYEYRCLLTNGYGTTTSAVVKLNVT